MYIVKQTRKKNFQYRFHIGINNNEKNHFFNLKFIWIWKGKGFTVSLKQIFEKITQKQLLLSYGSFSFFLKNYENLFISKNMHKRDKL